MAARTQGMIALLPTGNSTGSVKMLVIATRKIATRDQFTVVPMSVEVCTMLTASALKDGCVEAAKLWYEDLRAKLLVDGFTENPYDLCVFNKIGADGKQITFY
jgi:hypothetical protein